MRRLSGWILGLMAILAGLYPSLEELASRYAYRELSTGEAVRSAELVAVLGGGGGDRIRRGIQLVELGYAPRVLFLGSGPELDFAASFTRQRPSWAAGRVLFADGEIASTRDCVVELVRHCREERVETVLVVSDPPHLSRVRALLDGLSGQELRAVMVPTAKVPRFEDGRSRRAILREAVAYLAARITSFLPPPSPSAMAD